MIVLNHSTSDHIVFKLHKSLKEKALKQKSLNGILNTDILSILPPIDR